MQVDVPDMKGESGVKAGSKQDPKTFKSSSNLGIKVRAVQSSKAVFFSLLSQVLKTGQEIGFSQYLSSGLK